MKKTILIVDDFENTRFVVKFTLSRKGFEILEAADGKEALKLFDGRRIDLLITDLHMPNMNGVELVAEVRKLADYQYIPIIMLTTETDKQKKLLAEKAQVSIWIQKPFKMDIFHKIIERSLNQKL